MAKALETTTPVKVPRLGLRRFVHWRASPAMVIGTSIVGVFLVLAVLGSIIAPYDYTEFHMQARFQAPNADFILGTDNFGRDVLSRVIVGARSILFLAGSATLLGIVLGALIGIVSAYYGGWFDELVMRIVDGLMSIPSMLMALLIISMLGPATINLIVGIGIIYAPSVARVVRAAVLQERVKEYVAAAQVRGESTLSILGRELLPNVLPVIFAEAPIRFAYTILLSASLGFLGLGVQPPTPDWGLMVNEGRNYMPQAPWMVAAPAIAIALLIIGVSLLGDGLQQRLGILKEI